jgi:predicted TIM-barrel fold metal-dependent hydrolase
VLASYGEVFLGDPMFDPLFGELDRRSAVVLIHPTQHPPSKLLPLDLPLFVAEYPINTTRAALNLMTKGVLQRFPNIRFVLSHAGGVLPYLTWRLANPWVPPVFESDPKTMLRRFWYDIALSAGRQTLGCLKEVADPDKILFGTDWPYTTEESVRLTVKDFTQSGMFTPAQTADIERGNSLKLFPRLAR